ncbi:MAG: DNA polymerase III subunit delta [Rickettsiales bacterium]|jgi:DNA polymerase-3 subunit delta|nr:DNA polymerase III subunit delta [Rickettsiales bacterium]
MAKWKGGDFTANLRNSFKNVCGILFYGPDRGQSLENMAAASGAVAPDDSDGFSVFEFSVDDLKSDPSKLADEAAAIPFLGGRKVIRIRDAGIEAADAIEGIMKRGGTESLLLAVADELSPNAKLRVVFETNPKLAALPSYNDEGGNLSAIVRQTLAKNGIRRIPDDALAFICANLGENRATTRMELEKLCLYLHGKGEATVEDAQKCLMDSSVLSAQDLPMAVAEGNAKRLADILPRLSSEGFAPVAMLRATLAHFKGLLYMAGEIESGRPIASVIAEARPPIFFKLKPSYERQLRVWNSDRIIRALSRLNDAEVLCKRQGQTQETVVAQALFHLCGAAGKR